MNPGTTFAKILTENDVGTTGSHQVGVHVPKSQNGPLSILPCLDPRLRNPEASVDCVDEDGRLWHFRFVYYNGKLHRESDQITGLPSAGTRNEFRLCHIRPYLNMRQAKAGDRLTLEALPEGCYRISVDKAVQSGSRVVKLKGWHRVD